jgi:cytoplasmic iron level regulating protein YaaA (DUF328/UPF0246 family)
VLVLLPPSEAKVPGGDGPPVGRRPVLSSPELARTRNELLDALRRAARTQPVALAAGLKLPPTVAAAAIATDARARSAPTMRALDRYAGVVYQALDVAGLSPSARRRAEEQVLVLSGLWGVVRGDDLVPDYRVPASGSVPGLGGVTRHWRAALAAVMPALVGDRAVLDLRSTDYAGLWRPAGELAERVVAVRVLAERGTGDRRTTSAVSFHAKTVKGLLTRHLVTARRRHTDPMTALRDAAAALDLRVEVPTGDTQTRRVDLVGRYP